MRLSSLLDRSLRGGGFRGFWMATLSSRVLLSRWFSLGGAAFAAVGATFSTRSILAVFAGLVSPGRSSSRGLRTGFGFGRSGAAPSPSWLLFPVCFAEGEGCLRSAVLFAEGERFCRLLTDFAEGE